VSLASCAGSTFDLSCFSTFMFTSMIMKLRKISIRLV